MTPTPKIWEDFEMLDELEHFSFMQSMILFKFRCPDRVKGTKYDVQKKE